MGYSSKVKAYSKALKKKKKKKKKQ